MTLQAGLEAELPNIRAEALARMQDTFAFKVPTGDYAMVDGVEVEVLDDLFESPGFIPTAGGLLTEAAQAGERTVLSSRHQIMLPWDAQAVPANAVAVCTAVGALTPPRLLNRSFRCGGSDASSQGAMCHVDITEVLT